MLDLLDHLMLESTGPAAEVPDLSDDRQQDGALDHREEFAPGLDAELLSLIQATAEIEIAQNSEYPTVADGSGPRVPGPWVDDRVTPELILRDDTRKGAPGRVRR